MKTIIILSVALHYIIVSFNKTAAPLHLFKASVQFIFKQVSSHFAAVQNSFAPVTQTRELVPCTIYGNLLFCSTPKCWGSSTKICVTTPLINILLTYSFVLVQRSVALLQNVVAAMQNHFVPVQNSWLPVTWSFVVVPQNIVLLNHSPPNLQEHRKTLIMN